LISKKENILKKHRLNSNAPAAAAPQGVGGRGYTHRGGGEGPNNGLRPSLWLVVTRGVLVSCEVKKTLKEHTFNAQTKKGPSFRPFHAVTSQLSLSTRRW
jgi:hypothetical protein